MLCQLCTQKATVRCCSATLLCDYHSSQHLALSNNHHPQQLLLRLDPINQSILNTELQYRISALKNLKSKLKSYTKSLIKNIESLQSLLIDEINKKIQNYQKIFST